MSASLLKGVVEYLTPVLHSSAYASTGVLTPAEFTSSGDQLVHSSRTWAWEGGLAGTAKAYLQPGKQFLITRNVPCMCRANAYAMQVTRTPTSHHLTSPHSAHPLRCYAAAGRCWGVVGRSRGVGRRRRRSPTCVCSASHLTPLPPPLIPTPLCLCFCLSPCLLLLPLCSAAGEDEKEEDGWLSTHAEGEQQSRAQQSSA